jgi:hypothetical protein
LPRFLGGSEFLPGDGFDKLPRHLPSPSDLKYKIIIKNKKCKPADGHSFVPVEDAVDDGMDVVIDGETEQENEEEILRRRERSKEIAKELSDLVNYCTPYHFRVGVPRWSLSVPGCRGRNTGMEWGGGCSSGDTRVPGRRRILRSRDRTIAATTSAPLRKSVA